MFGPHNSMVGDTVMVYVGYIDSIYDVYYEDGEGTELHVAHYWYNGDTGSQINWVAKRPYNNYSKMECS